MNRPIEKMNNYIYLVSESGYKYSDDMANQIVRLRLLCSKIAKSLNNKTRRDCRLKILRDTRLLFDIFFESHGLYEEEKRVKHDQHRQSSDVG